MLRRPGDTGSVEPWPLVGNRSTLGRHTGLDAWTQWRPGSCSAAAMGALTRMVDLIREMRTNQRRNLNTADSETATTNYDVNPAFSRFIEIPRMGCFSSVGYLELFWPITVAFFYTYVVAELSTQCRCFYENIVWICICYFYIHISRQSAPMSTSFDSFQAQLYDIRCCSCLCTYLRHLSTKSLSSL